MNERIKELAEQAEILVTEVGAFHNTPVGAYQLKGEHLAKFAELIMRECNRIITNNGIATSEHDQCVRKDCVNEILDNFDINNTL